MKDFKYLKSGVLTIKLCNIHSGLCIIDLTEWITIIQKTCIRNISYSKLV